MSQFTATPAEPARGFDDFMARMTGSGRTSVERHVAACEKDLPPEHLRLWKRLVGLLGRLTPDAVPVSAARAVRFYVPDGKFKRQVFAVEDLRDGNLAVYLNDARPRAFSEGVLSGHPEAGSDFYRIGDGKGSGGERLSVELLTAASTTGAPDYYKHMLGWHRTAIRITLGRGPTAGQVRAAEAMCIMAAALPASQGAAATARGPADSAIA